MRPSSVMALLLIVLLPLALLGGLGWRRADEERQLLEHRFQMLAGAQLAAVDRQVQEYFAIRAQQLLSATAELPRDTASLRAFARREPGLRQVFLMDPQGARLHPPLHEPLTQAEQAFLERTAELWTDRRILYPQGPDGAVQPVGWYAWHWGAELDLIFWQRDERGLLGLELEPLRVLADLIARLPTARHAEAARIQLLDDRGSVLYQWGGYEPAAGQTPLAVLPLSQPLGSWKLAYHAPPLPTAASGQQLTLLAAFIAVALALAGLALYLYREHSRELRLAQQRVTFVNQVSHELKTPLTNIRLYAELLEEQIDDDETPARRYLAVIVGESQRLSRLIANVLNFARAQRRQLRLHPRPGQVDEVVAQVLDTFRPALSAKGMQIDFQAGAAARVLLDADAIEQILNNLLSNVEKYAADGKYIIISTAQRAGESVIRVSDSGPGIPARERARIFQPFYRVSSQLADGVAGAGIGLTIARELTRLHGGDLRLLPSQRGACFEAVLTTEPVEPAS